MYARHHQLIMATIGIILVLLVLAIAMNPGIAHGPG
jgi:hypothetical protein